MILKTNSYSCIDCFNLNFCWGKSWHLGRPASSHRHRDHIRSKNWHVNLDLSKLITRYFSYNWERDI